MSNLINEHFIKDLEWRSFEFLCYSIFKYFGKWDVELNGGGADRGADILLKDNETGKTLAVIQCKAYSKQQIKVNLVRELLGTMIDFEAKKGIFITTSEYTSSAIEFAKKNKIVIYSCKDIILLFHRLSSAKQQELYNIISSTDYSTPTCVSCGIKLNAKLSKNGNYFWGCPNFPKCRVTMNISDKQLLDINKNNTKSLERPEIYFQKTKTIQEDKEAPDITENISEKQLLKAKKKILRTFEDPEIPIQKDKTIQKRRGVRNAKSKTFLGLLVDKFDFKDILLFLTVILVLIIVSRMISFLTIGSVAEKQYITPTTNQTVEDNLLPKPKKNVNSGTYRSAKFQYEIILHSGGTIYTDSVMISPKTIAYKSGRGLVISLNRDEIKTMKRIRKN